MNNTTSPVDPFAGRVAATGGSEGYLGSSLDLQAGLLIRELRVSALPAEIVSELARMRRSWPAVILGPVNSAGFPA